MMLLSYTFLRQFHIAGVSVMVRISLVLVCLLFSSCYTITKTLNYPFRSREKIAVFSIDLTTNEEQSFMVDSLTTEKTFYAGMYPSIFRTETPKEPEKYLKGPFVFELCFDEHLDYKLKKENNSKIMIKISLSMDSLYFEKFGPVLTSSYLCGEKSGLSVGSFALPGNTKLNQKANISFQLLEDRNLFLMKYHNPKLVLYAGSGGLK